MRPLPKDSQKIIDAWPPHLSVLERAAQLQWIGPFTPDEFYLLTATSYAHQNWIGPSEVSAERIAIRKSYDDAITEYTSRRDAAQIAYDLDVAEHVERERDARERQTRNGRTPIATGEALIVNLPDTGNIARRLDNLKASISDLAECVAQRQAADLAQWARESIAPPPAERGSILRSRGRRS